MQRLHQLHCAVASNTVVATAKLHPQRAAPLAIARTGNLTNAQVWGLWSDLEGERLPAGGCTVSTENGAFNFPRTLQSSPIPAKCT